MMDISPLTQLTQHAGEAFARTEQVRAAAKDIAAAAATTPPPPSPPPPGP